MKKIILTACTIAIACGLTAQDRKVLFIGIDGVRSDALIQANTPNMDALMENGLYTYDSWHLGVTVSGSSWSNMLTGVWEAKHGVTNNSYTGSNYNDFPYFPTRAKEVRPDLKAVQVVSWGPMSNNVYNDGWDQKLLPPTDDACLLVAINQLQDPNLDILFIHLDDVDATGHGNGFSPDVTPYMNQIEYVDGQVGQLLNALYSRPNYANEDWLILATTDHGGIGLGHGGNSDEERAIWWVASGGGVANVEIVGGDPGSFAMNNVDESLIALTPVLTDIAVTALDHLLPDTDPESVVAWNLDGKSWLDYGLYVEENKADQMQLVVYPNPNNGVFYIKSRKELQSDAEITVLNLAGQVVKSFEEPLRNGSQQLINLSDLPPAVYMLRLKTVDSYATRRIIIK